MHLHKVLGILGNVISFVLFLSPIFTFITIVRKKAVEHFSPLPYLATLLGCMITVVYGLPSVHPNNILVLTMNGIGIPIESLWVIVFLIYSPRPLRIKILGILTAELIVVGAVLAGVLGGAHTHDKRSKIAGILCVIFNTASYASTIPILKIVFETKSVKYMPFSISLISLINGICWMFYSLLHFDLYILIPNALGALLNSVQLMIYFKYYRTTPTNEPEQNIEVPDQVVATNAPDSLSCVTVQRWR